MKLMRMVTVASEGFCPFGEFLIQYFLSQFRPVSSSIHSFSVAYTVAKKADLCCPYFL